MFVMMKFNPLMKVREVAGEHIVMRVGVGGADMTTVIALNESALLIYNKLQGREFGIDDAVAVLREEYDIDEPTARRDVENLVQEMRQNQLIVDA